MTEQGLHGSDIGAVFQQVRGERVSEGMGGDPLLDARAMGGGAHGALNDAFEHVVTPPRPGSRIAREPGRREEPVPPPIRRCGRVLAFERVGGVNGADVDPATCAPRGPGAVQICGVWRDPDFDPERRAVYYARVIENPSCRYSAWHCLGLEGGERPAGCDARAMAEIQQERAWTSPIWYAPQP